MITIVDKCRKHYSELRQRGCSDAIGGIGAVRFIWREDAVQQLLRGHGNVRCMLKAVEGIVLGMQNKIEKMIELVQRRNKENRRANLRCTYWQLP